MRISLWGLALSLVAGCAGAPSEEVDEAAVAYRAGLEHMGDEEPREAIACFERVLELEPRNYRAHFKLGIAYYLLGHYDLEIREYERVLELAPGYLSARLNLVHALVARGDPADRERVRRLSQELGSDPQPQSRWPASDLRDTPILYPHIGRD